MEREKLERIVQMDSNGMLQVDLTHVVDHAIERTRAAIVLYLTDVLRQTARSTDPRAASDALAARLPGLRVVRQAGSLDDVHIELPPEG